MDSISQYYLAIFLTSCTNYDSCTFSALSIYSEVFTRYLHRLSSTLAQISNHSGRTQPSPLDLVLLCDTLDINIPDLISFHRSRVKNMAHLTKFLASYNNTIPQTLPNKSNGNDMAKRPRLHPFLASYKWLPDFPSDDMAMGDGAVEAPIKLHSADWTLKRPTNPFLYVHETTADVPAVSNLPEFSDQKSLKTDKEENPTTKLINIENMNKKPTLPSSQAKLFTSNELLVTKATMNYPENPNLLEYPPMKKTKLFVAPISSK